MTSMRTFEALACGKPFLAAHSDAYEALSFEGPIFYPQVSSVYPWDTAENGSFMCWVDSSEDALKWGAWLLENINEAQGVAERGRAFVLANHTYGHRLRRMQAAIAGTADPEDWR